MTIKPGQLIRCPNADYERCYYPDCNCHNPQERNFQVMFERKTSGSPLAALADIATKLTFDEMHTLAVGIGADPSKINEWAKTFGAPVHPPSNPIADAFLGAAKIPGTGSP